MYVKYMYKVYVVQCYVLLIYILKYFKIFYCFLLIKILLFFIQRIIDRNGNFYESFLIDFIVYVSYEKYILVNYED